MQSKKLARLSIKLLLGWVVVLGLWLAYVVGEGNAYSETARWAKKPSCAGVPGPQVVVTATDGTDPLVHRLDMSEPGFVKVTFAAPNGLTITGFPAKQGRAY